MSADVRTYRFPARDRSGWLLGLQAAQCVILGAGVLAGGILLNLGAPGPVILLVICGSGIGAFAPVGGRPGYTWLPIIVGWSLGRRDDGSTWTAAVPRCRFGDAKPDTQPEWPPFLAGIDLHEHEGWRPGTPMVVISDRFSGALTGVLRATGREFALIDRTEQERLLSGWGDALAGFCKERAPVSAIRWFEWSAPAHTSAHVRWTRDHIGPQADPSMVDDYLDMVATAGPTSSRHETLVTVTLGGNGGAPRPLSRRNRSRSDRALVDTLRDELRLLADRLDSTGLAVDPPIPAEEFGALLRSRLDPGNGQQRAAGRQTLADAAGLERVRNAGPMATRVEWTHLVVDDAVHACFAIVEWPRLEVPPNWMEPLLLHAGGTRTVTVHLEPVAPSKSQRRVEKDSTRLVVDAEQRSRSGFRIGARHRRTESDVAARESELVAGYGELEYCGLVTITAADGDTLERSCAEWEQVAAHAGLELRRLNGQHDRAFACALPVAISPSRRSWE